MKPLRGLWRIALVALTVTVGALELKARGGGGCVAAGTLIDTPTGPRAIETLQVGDAVWSRQGSAAIIAHVQALYSVEPTAFVELDTPTTQLLVTPEHPVQTAPGTFVRADRLAGHATLVTAQGVSPLRSITRHAATGLAYNLLVSPGGVFFANGLLVHNKGCFLPDTPITMADGDTRPIGQIKIGDRVLAFDDQNHAALAEVHRILTHEVDRYLIVRTATTELHVTTEHPFYVGHGVFKTIESLHVGDAILAYDGTGRFTPQPILSMEARTGAVTVYNLEVDAPHTFVANGIAVHNKGGGCFAPGTPIRTPHGVQPIESLRLGDLVLSPDAAGNLRPATITGVYLNFTPLLILQTDHGTLRTTSEHPLLTSAGEFRAAEDFSVGQEIRREDGAAARIVAVVRRTAVEPVYTLQVAGSHTFIADGFVVHNKGGGGFHSSGFRSSGSSNSSGGSSPITAALVGIALLIFFVLRAIEWLGNPGDGENLDYCFPRAVIEPKAAKTAKLLEFIARVDDSVAPARLRKIVSDTFGQLQACWEAREYAPMKGLLMPDLYAQHCAQIRGLRQNHEINRLEHPAIDCLDLIHLHYTDQEAGRWFAALITASIRDYYVDDRTGAFLRGDETAAQFQEIWIFHFFEGTWRLREIEQSRETDLLRSENFFESFTETGRDQVYAETAGQAGIAGPDLPADVQLKDDNITRLLNFLVKTDRIWDREAMLATVRRTYSGVLLAWQDGRPDAFTGLDATPALLAHWRTVNATNTQNHWRVEYRNFCVRKLEIVHVRNRHERNEDEYTARISAHAQVVSTQNGTVRHQDEYVRPWVEFWTFGRDDRRWVLKEILPDQTGAALVAQENIDEGSSAEMLQWYYSKERAT